MTPPADDTQAAPTPNEAFALLGNGTRMSILESLAAADEPLSFSALREAVGMRDSGQFNYHLEQLVGHFVEQTESGYALRKAGDRVIEAILSGAVTEAPEFDLTEIDERCHLCGASVAVRYTQERVLIYCTECPGTYRLEGGTEASEVPEGYGYLGAMLLPPAGVQDRTPEAAYRAAWDWGHREILAMAGGLCPRCSATMEYDHAVCGDHDAAEGPCETCGRRNTVYVKADCTNCNYGHGGGIFLAIGAATPVLELLLTHGMNPIAPGPSDRYRITRLEEDYDEEVLATDPLRLRITLELDGETYSLTVDDTLSVVETSF